MIPTLSWIMKCRKSRSLSLMESTDILNRIEKSQREED